MMKRYRIIFLVYLLITQFLSGISGQNSARLPSVDKIVIDAGHGGFDYGAVGHYSNEKEITLAVALKTETLIKANFDDVEVILTRTEDQFVELHKRANIANENKADLFISIHCNSINTPKPSGAETYVMGLHKTQENLEVAKSENSAILMENNYFQQYDGFNPNLDEDYIVLNMAQCAGLTKSLDFAFKVQEKLHSVAGINNRGVKQAGFMVLYLTTMPGVLVETGFLSNPEEEKFLMESGNQEKIAQAIYEAFKEYKQACEFLAFHLKELPEDSKTVYPAHEPTITYRIHFATFKEFQPLHSKKFRGLDDLKVYFDNNEYHYAFGIANSMDEISQKLEEAKKMKRIKKRYLKNCKIVGFNEDNTIVTSP